MYICLVFVGISDKSVDGPAFNKVLLHKILEEIFLFITEYQLYVSHTYTPACEHLLTLS